MFSNPMNLTTDLLSLKVVVRCRDFEASRTFYTRVLGLAIFEEWEEAEGKGCILAMPHAHPACFVEVYAMTREDRRFDPAFLRPVSNDKIDLQIRTHSVDAWARKLRDFWPFEGPEVLPGGQRWIRLRDPDNLLIAIYEEEES